MVNRYFSPGRLLRPLAVGLLLGALIPTWLVANNAVEEFSLTSNPNGPWSYGYSDSLGGAISLYDVASTAPSGLQTGAATRIRSWE